jgi:hypothetical protein
MGGDEHDGAGLQQGEGFVEWKSFHTCSSRSLPRARYPPIADTQQREKGTFNAEFAGLRGGRRFLDSWFRP